VKTRILARVHPWLSMNTYCSSEKIMTDDIYVFTMRTEDIVIEQ
jgi:hypothetical protein